MRIDRKCSHVLSLPLKKGHSTTLCTLGYKEVISHYVNNNTSVYSCLLDVSKAFDRVHLGKLFSILLHTDIPTTVVRLYVDSYSRQKARVGWNNIMSEYLSVSNGVKQGGVLSSMLFSLYIIYTVVRLYVDSYSRQKARVGWNNIMSEYFSVSNGVKQGGVLSSMLFSLYIDPLLQKIETIRCWLPY